jgi:hypothetical protein
MGRPGEILCYGRNREFWLKQVLVCEGVLEKQAKASYLIAEDDQISVSFISRRRPTTQPPIYFQGDPESLKKLFKEILKQITELEKARGDNELADRCNSEGS